MSALPWPLPPSSPSSPKAFDLAAGVVSFWTSPQDVRDRKSQIDPEMSAVANDVASCAAFTAGDRAAWASFYAGWRQFYCVSSSGTCTAPDSEILNTVAQYNEADAWEQNLAAWQAKVKAANCKATLPTVAPPPPAPGITALQWGTVLAGLLLAGYVVRQTGLPQLFKKGK